MYFSKRFIVVRKTCSSFNSGRPGQGRGLERAKATSITLGKLSVHLPLPHDFGKLGLNLFLVIADDFDDA